MSKANEVACRSAPALAGAKGTRKRNTNEKARGKAEKPQKGKKNMKTTIVGWTKKKAFNGVIEGKQINSPEKVVFQLLQEVDNPDCHGKMVDTLKIPTENAIRLNGNSEDFNKLLGCDVMLNYQIFNGRSQLVDITVINADGTLHRNTK